MLVEKKADASGFGQAMTEGPFRVEEDVFVGSAELVEASPQDAAMANKGSGTADARSKKKKASES
jgi:hypothetical protein